MNGEKRWRVCCRESRLSFIRASTLKNSVYAHKTLRRTSEHPKQHTSTRDVENVMTVSLRFQTIAVAFGTLVLKKHQAANYSKSTTFGEIPFAMSSPRQSQIGRFAAKVRAAF